jgi:hypothetical protein
MAKLLFDDAASGLTPELAVDAAGVVDAYQGRLGAPPRLLANVGETELVLTAGGYRVRLGPALVRELERVGEAITFVLVQERGPTPSAGCRAPCYRAMGSGRGHALVVGGSGMLARLCRQLAREGWLVSVIGRDRAKLTLVAAGLDRIHGISADYEDLERFQAELAKAKRRLGPISLAVLWVRSWAPQSLLAAAAAVAPGGRVVRVVGSSASDASDEAAETLRCRLGSAYQEVRLGAVATAGGHRWLTDAEISEGVHKAIQSGAGDALVGEPTS